MMQSALTPAAPTAPAVLLVLAGVVAWTRRADVTEMTS